MAVRESAPVETAPSPAFRDSSAPPLTRISTGRMLGINAMWLGQGAHWQPISFSLLPLTAVMVAGSAGAAALLIGNVTAAGNLFALIAPILAGWLSDRTRTRWGRRRPWIVAGMVVNLAGLGLLAMAGGSLMLAAAYIIVQLSFNTWGGAYSAVIPDVVPEEDRGRASGLLGMMNNVGSVIGLAAVIGALAVFHQTRTGLIAGYSAIAVILVITTIITVIAVKEPALAPIATPKLSAPPNAVIAIAAGLVALAAWTCFLLLSLGSSRYVLLVIAVATAAVAVFSASRVPQIRQFFVAFRDHDFVWTFATRAFMMMGISTIQPFLALYFRDVVRAENYSLLSGIWGLTVLAGAVVPAVIGGNLSDKFHRRKIFVYLSGGLQVLVAAVLLFGLVSSLPIVYGLGIAFGIGYGMYIAVDWAIACDVLPDREKGAGRDMGLWHIAFTLPPALAPALFGPILYLFNQPDQVVLGMTTGDNLGFRLVFAGAVFWFIFGTLFVRQIRSVR